MAMSVDEKAYMKTYVSRKVRTIPFLVIMAFSLMPLLMFSFQYVRGQFAWHKTEAIVVMVNDDGSGFYHYVDEQTGEDHKGMYSPYRVLIHYRIGKAVEVNDRIPMAYDPNQPDTRILFPKTLMQMATWAIVFLFCFIMYFWLEWALKKRAKIKIAG
ncbi:MAG: hypothetical protein II916_04290 [Oscillospiraceae bacterium]|nr:hypothetical protein [Oscillospiraceae bacterium]